MSPTAPSKSLIKLVDLAILPAAILICVKIVSMLVLNASLGLSWDVKAFADAFFGVKLVYANEQDLMTVISYSNLLMHLYALSGAVLALMKLFYLHPKFVKPGVVLKLAKSDRLHYIQSSFHLYHEAIVWSIFLVVTDLLIVFNFIQGLTFEWILGVSVFTTLVLIFILIRSIDRDIEEKNTIKYKKL